MYDARIAKKLRDQLLRFSGELSQGLPKVVCRFIAEMLLGIQARQSVRLTEVSRASDERIRTKKTVERLSRQLGNPGLWARLTDRLLELAAERVRETTLLILDLSDVHKKYAKKMEHLATVWDGSEKTKNRGYWTLNIVAAKTRRRGIWVMDRGGDRGYLYDYLLDNNLRFLIRLRADRTLVTSREESALEAAQSCPMLFNEYVAKEETGEEKPLRLEVGCRKVRLPGHPEELTLVVVRGFGKEPRMLLTNMPPDTGPKIDLACRQRLSDPLADRRDPPLPQTKLLVGGHPGSALRPIAEHDGDPDGRRLLHGGLSGLEAEVTSVVPPLGEGGPPRLRDPGLPALCPGRRDPTVSLQPDPGTEEALSATKRSPCPSYALRSIIFWGNSWLIFP